jgi:hypothetical protein
LAEFSSSGNAQDLSKSRRLLLLAVVAAAVADVAVIAAGESS